MWNVCVLRLSCPRWMVQQVVACPESDDVLWCWFKRWYKSIGHQLCGVRLRSKMCHWLQCSDWIRNVLISHSDVWRFQSTWIFLGKLRKSKGKTTSGGRVSVTFLRGCSGVSTSVYPACLITVNSVFLLDRFLSIKNQLEH